MKKNAKNACVINCAENINAQRKIAEKIAFLRDCITDDVAMCENVDFENVLNNVNVDSDCFRADNFMIDSFNAQREKSVRLLEVWGKKSTCHVVARMSANDCIELLTLFENAIKRDAKKSNSKRQLLYIEYSDIIEFINTYLSIYC